MGRSDEPLPDDVNTCHRPIRELLDTLRTQVVLNEKLQHQLEQLLRRIYGNRSAEPSLARVAAWPPDRI
jgi:hypothetical protein